MKKKGKTKFLAAVFLGLLAVTGGAIAMPFQDIENQSTQLQESIKIFEKNPERFLQTENLGLKNEFGNFESNYFGENYEYNAKNAVNEGALDAAIKNGDYETWKEILKKIDGFSENTEFIDKEDFDILVALHQAKNSDKEKEIDN